LKIDIEGAEKIMEDEPTAAATTEEAEESAASGQDE
jgi:hypothetical protein